MWRYYCHSCNFKLQKVQPMADKRVLRTIVGWPLVLLLASEKLIISGQDAGVVKVCGSDYSDAQTNCKVNKGCPNGDGCPPEAATCFAIPDFLCIAPPTISPAPTVSVSPTTTSPTPRASTEPSAAPTISPYFICGSDYEDAEANCRTNVACPNLDNTLCPPQTACFTVPASQCSTPEPTDYPSLVPSATPPLKVCGISYDDALENCLENDSCPNGDDCGDGQAWCVEWGVSTYVCFYRSQWLILSQLFMLNFVDCYYFFVTFG